MTGRCDGCDCRFHGDPYYACDIKDERPTLYEHMVEHDLEAVCETCWDNLCDNVKERDEDE